jgi:hypothetical protein
LNYENDAEKRVVRAALESMQVIFNMPLLISDQNGNQNQADWVLSDHNPQVIHADVLYVISNQVESPNPPRNLIQFKESFLVGESDWVTSGQLPEKLMELILAHKQMDASQTILSTNQLQALFVLGKEGQDGLSNHLHAQILTLLFLILFLVERYFSLTNATKVKHA